MKVNYLQGSCWLYNNLNPEQLQGRFGSRTWKPENNNVSPLKSNLMVLMTKCSYYLFFTQSAEKEFHVYIHPTTFNL